MTGSKAATEDFTAMRTAWRSLIRCWGLTWMERRELLPADGESSRAPPMDTRTRMGILIEIAHRLRFDHPHALADWLREPTEILEWRSPLDAMSGPLSDLRHVRRLVEAGYGS